MALSAHGHLGVRVAAALLVLLAWIALATRLHG